MIYVHRCSLKLLFLFSLNVNLNIEGKTLCMQYYHNSTISLVHTASDFSSGVATVWTHRDHTVATPASTALNRDKLCWTVVHRDVAPVVSTILKPPGLTGTHWAAKQHRLIPGHHRSSSGMNRISTVRPPGETVANWHELCPRWRYSDSRLGHGVSQKRAGVAPTLAGRTTVWHDSIRWMPVKLRWNYGMTMIEAGVRRFNNRNII